MFASLQSRIGNEIINAYNIDTYKTDSILLFEHDKGISYKSTAGLKIASKLGFPTNLLIIFLIIPAFIRNWFYDYIARNRYKWFGKKEACMVPTPEISTKFLT